MRLVRFAPPTAVVAAPRRPARSLAASLRAAADGHWAACFLLALAWYGATAWLRPLAIPDEGRYVGVAREMLQSGNWGVPTLNGAPFFHKPPLFYWLTAASMQWLGADVLAARLASVLAAAAATTGLYAYLRRWADADRASWAVVVLASMPLYFGGAQYANLDMLVASCIGGCVLAAAHASNCRDAGAPYRFALACAFAIAALGVLAKGLIGAVLPLLVLSGWGLATRRVAATLRLLGRTPGILLFFAIAAPWFIAMQSRYAGFYDYFFVVQHVKRFASTGFNNPQPLWFYPAFLMVATIPWSCWLIALSRRSYWRRADPSHTRSLMAVWVAVVLVFFSIPSSKLAGYVLPALLPLAFLVSDALHHVARGREGRDRRSPGRLGQMPARTLSVALGVLLCVCPVIALHFLQPKSMQDLATRMASERHADEPVIFLESYYYDLAFYADLTAPVLVVDAWSPAELARDGWRRELFDAMRFMPVAARRDLLLPEDLPPLLCKARGAWVIGPVDTASRYAFLGKSAAVDTTGRTALWHVGAGVDSHGCPRTG